MWRALTLRFASGAGHASCSCTAPELARCFEFMRNMNVRPLISQVLPLYEYATAQANLEARKVTGRIVLQVADHDW